MTTICRHIKTNGQRCGSPALANHVFCYFHRTLAQRHPKPARALGWGENIPTIIHPLDPTREPHLAATHPALNLPPLEDRESIQLAASMIVGALAGNGLDPKRAGILLYGLQVASANARQLNYTPLQTYAVTETVLTPAGDEIAPDEDPEGELLFQELVQGFEQSDDEESEAKDDEAQPHQNKEIAA